MKLTDYQTGKPERVGVYLTQTFELNKNPPVYRYWNGVHWCSAGTDIESAYRRRHGMLVVPGLDKTFYCGLAEEPK